MILVTGASGHLGGSIIRHLTTLHAPGEIVALVRDEDKAAKLKELGIRIRVGNYHDVASLKSAMAGVQKVVLVSTNDFNDRLQQHKNVADAALQADVGHLVYTGVSMKDVQQSVLRDMMLDHFNTEDYIKQIGLPYTMMRHNIYADMIPFYLGEHAVSQGVSFPSGNGRLPFALRSEMGEADANVISSDIHIGKTYDISNTETYSFADIAHILGKLAGKVVSYESPAPETYVKTLERAGLPAFVIHAMAGFAGAIQAGEFDLPGDTLGALIGRKPAGIEGLLKDAYRL